MVVPENNEIRTECNGSFYYDQLIIASGTQPVPEKIPGLQEALDDRACPVGSIYIPKYALKYNQLRENLKLNRKEGKIEALFTQPASPIKCGGAPQKILHLSHEEWDSNKLDVEYSFLTGTPAIFPSPHYVEALTKQMESKGVKIHLESELVSVDGNKRTATFRNTSTNESFEKSFDILHATPICVPPEFLTESGLASANGYADVNINTLMHNKYTNIWALGDSANLPTSKTSSAVNAQIWVLTENLRQMRSGVPIEELSGRYEGYTASPVLLGDQNVMMIKNKNVLG